MKIPLDIACRTRWIHGASQVGTSRFRSVPNNDLVAAPLGFSFLAAFSLLPLRPGLPTCLAFVAATLGFSFLAAFSLLTVVLRLLFFPRIFVVGLLSSAPGLCYMFGFSCAPCGAQFPRRLLVPPLRFKFFCFCLSSFVSCAGALLRA